MPITRFEIRNQYTLGDPQLYRAADKDDPEALLEGVAMAGLVGLLRQLGDLAEFAAEIFHNLHEQVMTTAARGHSLMIRVQQLEADVPSIESAFLSQTDHSSTFYNAGLDWHPNLRMDTNLITQGDLPRFVMDSYEECRPPPRLFLMDKFDVAGAGACLKRYTNPSFFKVETDDTRNADFQREKRILKLRKRGPRWRNGETTEASHTKLHQLFLEERTENGVNKHSRRVKLKRRLNGFPFDSRTGRSYMEKILNPPSSDHEVFHEVDVYSLLPATSDETESGHEALQVRPVSPDRGSVERERSFHPSPDRKENVLNPSIYEPDGVTSNDQVDALPDSYCSFVTGGTSSTDDKETAEKVIAVDAENNSEGYLTGYASSVVASEVENFVDATSILEAEMDTEAEFPLKNDLMAPDGESRTFVPDANEEHQSTWISDCLSSIDSILSDDGNSSHRKEMSVCSSSDFASNSAENQQPEISVNRIPSRDTPEIEMVISSSYQRSTDQGLSVDQLAQTVACGHTCISTDAINCPTPGIEQRINLCSNESIGCVLRSESEGVVTEAKSKQPEHVEIPSAIDDDKENSNLAIDQPFCPVSDIEVHSGDNSANIFVEHLLNEPEDEVVPCASVVPDIKSCNLLHDGGTVPEDENMAKNKVSTSNMINALSQSGNDAPAMMPTTRSIPGGSDDEGPKLPGNMSSGIPHNEDGIKSTVPQENLFIELGSEVSNGSTDCPTYSSDMVKTSYGQEINEILFPITQTLVSENMEIPHLSPTFDHLQEDLDADKKDVLSEQVTTVNVTFPLESPTSYDAVGLPITEAIKHDFPSDSEPVGSPVHTTECLEEPVVTSDAVEINGEVTGISHCADVKPPNEAKLSVDEPDSEGIANRDEVSTVCIISENTIVDNAHLSLGIEKVEELVHCPEDLALDKLENGKNSLSGDEEAVGQIEKIKPMEAAALDSEAALSNYGNCNHPVVDASDAVFKPHPDLATVATIKSPEHEVLLQRNLGNDVPDAKSVSIDYNAEELRTQEEAGLPTNQDLSLSGGITSESSSSLSSNHLQTIDHDDQKGDNDSTPGLSLIDSSTSELLNHNVGVPGYPKDPLTSIYTSDNLSTESDEVNLADVAPLPPLPPAQWMMGNFQQDSASMEGGVIKHVEFSSEMVTPLDARADGVGSSLANASSDNVNTSPKIASSPDNVSSLPMAAAVDYVSLSPGEMTNSPLDEATSCPIAPEPESKEKEAKSNCSTLEIKETCEAIDVMPNFEENRLQLEMAQLLIDAATNTEDKQQQSEMPQFSPESALCPIQSAPKPEPKEEEAKDICSILEIKNTHAMIDVVPTTEKKQRQSEMTTLLLEEATHPIQIVSKPGRKEEDSTLEIKDMSNTIDVVPHLESKPTLKNEFISPEEDKGLSHGSRKVKLPLPRNPLVEDVSVLDKSKLRKVTPRERPQIQKVEERDAFLEQIRNRSFNLKPTMASRPTIQQPKTNLRVAAILEKANAIRQALAGSDDDDDDDDNDRWSDS